MLKRIGAEAGLSRYIPIFGLTVFFRGVFSTVQVDAGTDFGDVSTAAMERVVNGKEMLGGERIHPLDGQGMASADIYHKLLDAIQARNLKANVSVKLTQVGMDLDPAPPALKFNRSAGV